MKVFPFIFPLLLSTCSEFLVAEKNYRREMWVIAAQERQAAAAKTKTEVNEVTSILSSTSDGVENDVK